MGVYQRVCPIKDSEREAAQANGIEPVELRVGTDAVTIVFNPQADWLDDITVEQLAMIWRPNNPLLAGFFFFMISNLGASILSA